MLSRIDLTPASRPQLLPDETILTVQNAVGLYEGKYKIPNYQNGCAYLTSHRACYVDNAEPRKYSVAVELKDVERVEPYAGFLKSSPKITLHLKPAASRSATPASPRSSTPLIRPASPPLPLGNWICSICSFSNPIPSNYTPGITPPTSIPPCLTCGIRPSPAVVEKAFQKRPAPQVPPPTSSTTTAQSSSDAGLGCPRCTFHNHPSLLSCELCGENLRSPLPAERADSPGPLSSVKLFTDVVPIIKFSFRSGGNSDRVFLTQLRSALIQRKWLLHNAPPLPAPNGTSGPGAANLSASGSVPTAAAPEDRLVGIAGLERKGINVRKKNELALGGAFEDLEALMSRAKEMVTLAESFATRLASTPTFANSEANNALRSSTAALGLVTKEMMGSGDKNSELYISELARQVAEFLSDDTKSVLKREGGVITLVDLWAVYNRARGIDLISPADLEKACRSFEKLRLPVRLRRFKSGLLVVQEARASDGETVRRIVGWLGKERGCTASEAAERFGWSVGVASEELEMAEERGAVCREVGVEGVRFWKNRFVEMDACAGESLGEHD